MSARRTAIRSLKVTIPTDSLADTPSGKIELAGALDIPPGLEISADDSTPVDLAGAPVALVAHCFTCNKNAPGASRISKTLARNGVLSLRIDFPGLGKSAGKFEHSTLNSNVRDLECASQWLADNYAAPHLLVGHSLGGVAAIRAGSSIDSVQAVAAVGAPFYAAHAADSVADAVAKISSDASVAEIMLARRPILIGRDFFEDLGEGDPAADVARLGKLNKALIVAHCPDDLTVAFRNAQQIFAAALQPASLLSLSDVDHLLTWPGSGQKAGNMIWAVASQFVDVA